ncbi:hypothetical protein BC941DRAFT_445437 [Chlamydoabsidia padenii]|nr:hypothetical protein BC941DRAFT_445437 [Chlamydoabsidia padenii]
MNHDVPDTNEKSISSSRRGLFYADPPAAPPPYQQQERTSINLDDDNSPSYSDYGTPMGSLTPPEPQQQTRYYHPGTLTSGMPKSPVRNDGISMPILSQRLSMLLQQQQQQQEGRKLSGIKSWISFFLNFVLYMENNLVVSITKYRFWLYCFAFLWMWRKGAHRLPLLRSFFIGNIYQPQRSNVSPLLS